MAARLKQLQSKACQATQFVSKHGSVYYKQLLEDNKKYIQEPATLEKCNELSKQLLYTRLARSLTYPPLIDYEMMGVFCRGFVDSSGSAFDDSVRCD